MNPIVYNKNGQFRFNDFVGYLPEFLKTEPDVVTLMQVMSDYINNAYRNIETTEEFEFVRVCTSSDQGAVRTSMERLSDMLRLAAERGDAVRYLSVPRNNVKSNVIIGNEGAEYAREAEIDLPEIQDVITSASGRHLVDDRLKDGSVVYIRYRNADPIRTIAYYYSAADDTLVKEPAGNSQDPFTGSDNNPQTSIEFKVSDVGHVLRRYGGSSNDRAINYYEIFFTVKITDVKRVNALDSVFVDVDGVDNKDDQVLVDYYNQSATAQGNYNAFIKFAEGNSFNWVGEFPSGIFYLRDTSSSKLTTVSSSNYIPMTDTALSPEIDRYRVSRIDVDSTGMLKIYTATGTPGIYSDALMYLMHGNEQVALLKMNSDITSKSRKDDGELYTTVFPVSLKYDIYDIIWMISDKKSLTLVSIPLAQSYYTLDINNKRPLIRWEEEYTFPDGMSVDLSDNVTMNEAYVYQNYIAARVRSSEWQQLGLRSFYTTYPIPVGLTVMCPELWGGVATVTESRYDNAKGKYYTETDSRFLPSFDPATLDEIVITHPSVGVVLSQFASNDETGEHAYVVQSDDGWNVGDVILAQCVVNGDTENSEYRMFTVTAVELDGNGKYIIHVFHPSYDSTTGLGIEIVDYTQLSRVVESNNTRISSIDNVHRQGENIVATARRYTGPIFTASYMAARLKDGDRSQFSLLKMVADVKWYYPVTLTTGGYDDGTYVYNPDDQNVYRVKKSIVTKGDETVEQYDLVLDNIKHYSVGYKKIYNAFMPYAGAVSTLDYGEQIDYAADDMSTVRLPLYIKKTNDMRLRYGWKEREYLYYGNDIGIGDMERAGFVEFYAGNPYNVVDVDMADRAVTVIDESETGVVLKKGVSPVYVIDIDKNLTAIKNSDGRWVVTLTSAGHGLASGMKITVSDVTVSTPELSEIFNVTDATIRVVSPDVIEYESDSTVEGLAYTGEVDKDGVKALAVYNRPVNGNTGEPLKEGDVVEVLSSANDEFYVVSASNWKKVDRNAVLTPFTLYSQQNLFDVSLTNPAFAMSEGYKVHRIRFIDKNTAQVNLAGRIPSSDLRKGTRVFIRFANHSAYNGWHMVTSVVNGGGIFNIKIDGDDGMEDGLSLVGREMTLYVGMWHKYTVYAYDWNKVSNFATYATTNSILEVNGSIVRTKYKHGFSVGDRVIVDQSGDGAYNYDGGSLDNFIEAVVVDVPSDETVVLDLNIERDPDNGPNVVKYGTIYRGCIVRNNVGRLNGEYTWRGHRFIDGEIVIATDQICEDENIAWRVSKDSAWIPMRKKRTFKIVRIDVDMMPNPKFDETNPVEEESELKYRVFGDNVVYTEAESGSAYLQAFGMTRNYHFDQPYLENLDTTQDVQLQYSSKYDYGTVAPRDDMDSSFKGVPDMDYSLAERIERLAYLKDASVIDYDLIGYLARFMGYDITAVADDVSESGVYNTNAERENALRETISHLPQYYALNGTKAGINMLMATFGLVGELITMWTNTADPYGELVRQTDIDARVQKESTLGRAGQWVPTPHVVLDVLDEPTFPSVSVTSEDIERVREQIRCCKPINVVFDGIRVVMKAYDNAGISVVAHDMGARYGVNPIFLDSGERVATYDENVCLEEDCSF